MTKAGQGNRNQDKEFGISNSSSFIANRTYRVAALKAPIADGLSLEAGLAVTH
jgi:hypothetical protein